MRKFLCLVSSVGILVAAHGALAQTDLERATARDAANNGRAAYDAGKYEKAIDYLSRAEQLVHAPTHLLFIARAQVKLGRLVAAHETYLKITRETLAPNAPKAFVTAQASAEQEQEAIDERLPTVTVVLQGATNAPDVTFQMDGTPLPSAMIGIPVPVDPGEHVFKASGPTIDSDPVTVKLAEAAKQTVTLRLRSNGVVLPPPAANSPGTKAATGAGTSAAVAATVTPTSNGSLSDAPPPGDSAGGGHGPGWMIASIASFGLGLASAGVGTYYLVKSSDTRNESDALYQQCIVTSGGGEDKCKDEELQHQIQVKDNEADHQSKLGIVGMAGAGVGIAAGITFLIVDVSQRSSSASHSTPHVTPVFGFRSIGLVGTF